MNYHDKETRELFLMIGDLMASKGEGLTYAQVLNAVSHAHAAIIIFMANEHKEEGYMLIHQHLSEFVALVQKQQTKRIEK
jgi:hypothetical protein